MSRASSSADNANQEEQVDAHQTCDSINHQHGRDSQTIRVRQKEIALKWGIQSGSVNQFQISKKRKFCVSLKFFLETSSAR